MNHSLMVRILIRRSDGILQHYRIKKARAIQMASAIELVKYRGLNRYRRIYASVSVMPLEKKRVYPTITERKQYANVEKVSSDRPIHGQPGQVHVRLRAFKDGRSDEADGYSHILDLERQYARGKFQATEHALLVLGYYVDTDLYNADGQTGNGRPDHVQILKTDFVYILKK